VAEVGARRSVSVNSSRSVAAAAGGSSASIPADGLLSEAQVTAQLLNLVGGDESRLGGCYMAGLQTLWCTGTHTHTRAGSDVVGVSDSVPVCAARISYHLLL